VTSLFLFSDSTTNAIGSCSDRPGPEGVYKDRRAESSLGARLESGVKTNALSGSERPSSLHRARFIDATVRGGAKDFDGMRPMKRSLW
jgi:hypothetical protein